MWRISLHCTSQRSSDKVARSQSMTANPDTDIEGELTLPETSKEIEVQRESSKSNLEAGT